MRGVEMAYKLDDVTRALDARRISAGDGAGYGRREQLRLEIEATQQLTLLIHRTICII